MLAAIDQGDKDVALVVRRCCVQGAPSRRPLKGEYRTRHPSKSELTWVENKARQGGQADADRRMQGSDNDDSEYAYL